MKISESVNGSAAELPVIGSHRKPAAVLMPAETLILLEHLLSGMAKYWAQFFARSDPIPGVIHPGDPVGKVIAWLWRSGQRNRLDEFVSIFIMEMRDHTEPRARFSDLLAGIPMALPNDFADRDIPPLIDFLTQTVPRGFSEDIDQP